MTEYEEDKWYRDGNLLYTVKHDGYVNGKKAFRNRVTVRIEGTKEVSVDEEDRITAHILNLLETQPA